MNISLSSLIEIPITKLDRENRLTDFSMGDCPEKLLDSIKVIGVRHPISVCQSRDLYSIVSGHKRFQATIRAGLTTIPAFVIPETDDASRLVINLNENFGQSYYSDIEKGRILDKLKGARIPDRTIIDEYMPLLELESSKKIFEDLARVEILSPGLKKLLHLARVPVKTFSTFYKWDEKSRAEVEKLFSRLKVGVNKWRDLLELIDEIAARDNKTPKEILARDEIREILKTSDRKSSQEYDPIHKCLYELRYKVISDLKKQIARAVDAMELNYKTRLRFNETFESSELKLELKFHTEKELSQQVEKIFKALQSGSVESLIKIFQTL